MEMVGKCSPGLLVSLSGLTNTDYCHLLVLELIPLMQTQNKHASWLSARVFTVSKVQVFGTRQLKVENSLPSKFFDVSLMFLGLTNLALSQGVKSTYQCF